MYGFADAVRKAGAGSSIDAFIEKFREVILPGFRMRHMLLFFYVVIEEHVSCCDRGEII